MSASLPLVAVLTTPEHSSPSLSRLQQCHANMLKTGIFLRSSFDAGRLLFSIVSSSSPTSLAYADTVFARIPDPNSFTWNTIIRAHANASDPETALLLFLQMLSSPVMPDRFTFPLVLKVCSVLLAVEVARQVHCRVVKSGFGSDLFVQNTLIHFYAAAGLEEDAHKVFDRMLERDIVSWNALISSYAARGEMGRARMLFDGMSERDTETWNFMISGYASLGLVDEARELFDEMLGKDVVSWNAMITGYARTGRSSDLLVLFQNMQKLGIRPDGCTLVNVLSACARVGALAQGGWVHAYMERNRFEIEGFLCTALVDMYSKCGDIVKALEVFWGASSKDVSTWSSMIAGLSSHGREGHALMLFKEMLASGIQPNEITYINVLCACSHAGFLDEGLRIFNEMVKVYKIEPNVIHYGCLVDLLARAGELEKALQIIRTLQIDSVPEIWKSLLSSCRMHGHTELAEYAAKKLLKLSRDCSSSYIQLSNVYASLERWDDVQHVRGMMRERQIHKEPGCSTIEIDGIFHEFFAGHTEHNV